MEYQPSASEMQKLLDRLKQDPQFEMHQELGKMLFRHINSFTPEERKRYDELIELLKPKA